jgi:hypothetical protein
MAVQFSAINAAVFLDTALLVDTVAFEFTDSQQKLPIYGYKSVLWDDVLLGDRVITGGFSVHYRDGYSLNQYLWGQYYENDELTVPSVTEEEVVAIDRRRCNLTVSYMSNDFKKIHVDDHHKTVTADIKRLGLTADEYASRMTKLGLGTGQDKTPHVANVFTEELSQITIEDAIITKVQQSIVPDDASTLEFYSFIARKVV